MDEVETYTASSVYPLYAWQKSKGNQVRFNMLLYASCIEEHTDGGNTETQELVQEDTGEWSDPFVVNKSLAGTSITQHTLHGAAHVHVFIAYTTGSYGGLVDTSVMELMSSMAYPELICIKFSTEQYSVRPIAGNKWKCMDKQFPGTNTINSVVRII